MCDREIQDAASPICLTKFPAKGASGHGARMGDFFAAVMMTSITDTDIVLFPIGHDYDLDFKILH